MLYIAIPMILASLAVLFLVVVYISFGVHVHKNYPKIQRPLSDEKRQSKGRK